MEQRRFGEAAQELAALLQTKEFLDEQSGAAYLTLFVTYMEALTQARRQYNQALDVGIELLKAANAREREMKEGIDLARLQSEIAALQR